MRNVKTLAKSYVTFANIQQLTSILEVFERLGFNYANGSTRDALDVAHGTAVDKVTIHDNFVFTSKDKANTISFNTFMSMADSLTSNDVLVNNNINMSNTNPRAIINSIKADRLFKDEKYLEGLVEKSEGLIQLVEQFDATLDKAREKGNKLCELVEAYSVAIADREISEIERLEKLIDSSVAYVTKTNDILKSISATGKAIIKANKKADPVDGKAFIGE